jgi:hypothetical protein
VHNGASLRHIVRHVCFDRQNGYPLSFFRIVSALFCNIIQYCVYCGPKLARDITFNEIAHG